MPSNLKKVAIIGSVGIPAKYGGFETLVENLSLYLSSQLDITVYCSSKAYPKKVHQYNNARLRYLPLNANGAQSIPYDILSIAHALFFSEILLILGVSGCCILPLIRLFSKKKIVINIDGLEWKRNKWGKFAKWFLKFSEKMAIRYGDVIVADNVEIQKHVKDTYGKDSVYIPYGGDHSKGEKLQQETLELYPFLLKDYAFKVCRIEPENNIEMILEAFSLFQALDLVIVGNWLNSEFGKKMKEKYSSFENIHLIDPIYNQTILNEIRSGCKVYIHGHSAGGTNPSLVEAMYLGLPIFAFNIPYNIETTLSRSRYFSSHLELMNLISNTTENDLLQISNEMRHIATLEYTWSKVTQEYAALLN